MDGGDDFFEVALVLVGVDGFGVVGAEAGFLAFHEGGFDFCIFGLFVHEVPDFEGFVGEEDGAFGAGELDASRVAVFGPSGGGGFDDAAGTVFEFKEGNAVVFDFDVLVGEEGGVGLHGFDGSGEVEEGVDGVDGLVHEGAAAVEGPSAAPSAGVVVGLVAIPFDVGAGGGEGAEATLVGRFFEGVHAGVEAAVEDGSEGDLVGLGGGDELVDALGGDFEGFLDDGVLAGVESGEGGVEVGTGGGADGDDVEVGVSEKGVEVGVGLGAEVGGEGLGFFWGVVVDGAEGATGHVGDGLGVEAADHTGADDSEVHGLEFTIFWFEFSR